MNLLTIFFDSTFETISNVLKQQIFIYFANSKFVWEVQM